MYIPGDHATIQGVESQIASHSNKGVYIHHRVPSPDVTISSKAHISLVVFTVPLALLVGGLGKHLLPDGAGAIMIEVGEENVEDFRVPADWVTFDALLDIL